MPTAARSPTWRPDLDLVDAAQAYWGSNLARLKQVKAAVDPDNLFRHAQSVPLP